jgi:hypothetical protein
MTVTSALTTRSAGTPTPPPASEAADRLLTPGEVAALFRVDPKTVTRWAKAGRVHSIRTVGGHHRYPAGQFAHLLAPAGRPPAHDGKDQR